MSDAVPVVLQIVEKLLFSGCVLLVCKRTYCWFVKWDPKWILTLICLAISICFSFAPNPFSFFSDPLSLIAILFVAEGKLGERLLNLLIVHYGLELFQFVFVSLKVLVAGLEKDSAILFAFINLMLLVLVLIVTKRKWYRTAAMEFCNFSKKKRLFILGVFIAADAMAAVGSIVRDMIGGEGATAFFCIIMIFMLIGVIGSIAWLLAVSHESAQYKEQSRLKEEIIHSQKMYYQAMLEKEQTLRAFRHDIGNQLGVLSILCDKGDDAELKRQLDHLVEDFHGTGMHHVSVGDEVIDAILNVEFEKATKLGIRFQVNGSVENTGEFDPYDLCAVFSNSVRNAIEACEARPEDAEINLNVRMHNGTLYYRIENTATEEAYRHVMDGQTSKENQELHGFGIKNLRRAVERMNGRLEYHYQDQKVILEVFA